MEYGVLYQPYTNKLYEDVEKWNKKNGNYI